MSQPEKLLAWIEPKNDGEFVAALVGGAARQRVLAIQVCASAEQAREWVEHEAAELDVPFEWAALRGTDNPR